MNRPITFRKIEAGHYINDETGVDIVKVGMPGSSSASRWIVRRPSYRHNTVVVGGGGRKADVMATAVATVEHGRKVIATAYVDAADFDVELAAAKVHFSGLSDPYIKNMITAARTAVQDGKHDQARSFAREAVDAMNRARHVGRRPTTSDAVAMMRAGQACIDEDHQEALDYNAAYQFPPANDAAPDCKAPLDGPGGGRCARPLGHQPPIADGIGHAPVRYPEGTPEYAAYRRTLLPQLEAWKTEGIVQGETREGKAGETFAPMRSRGTGGGKTRDSGWLLSLGRGTGLPEFGYAREVSQHSGTSGGAIDAVARKHLLVGCAAAGALGVLAKPCTEFGQHRHEFDAGEVVFGTTDTP